MTGLKFKSIHNRAAERKGGITQLEEILVPVNVPHTLTRFPSDRVLSQMTRGVFQSGFVWKIIEQKWPGFEEVFLGFNIEKLYTLPPETWDSFCQDTRIVRNHQKIQSVFANMLMIRALEKKENKTIAQFINDWPSSDLVGLWAFLKKEGSRLGGMTGQYFLRRIGKDSFMLSRDVVKCLQTTFGLDIKDIPSSKKDLTLIQALFNILHQETGQSYTNLSRIMAFSIGDNYDVSTITSEIKRFEKQA